MDYREISPEDRLKPFIKCFYIFHSDSAAEFEDVVFPSGFTEIVFNLGPGSWEAAVGTDYKVTPQIELWGQITRPLPIKSKGKHQILGVRFFPHSAGYFLMEEIEQFNNTVSDLTDVLGGPVKTLHNRLLETNDLISRIKLIEIFLIKRLSNNKKRNLRNEEIGHLLYEINKNYTENTISLVASQHGISTRYLHKLVYQYTGLSPKLFHRINRFQHSLKFITQNEESLTAIAYECGYFDQSHFIKDFKSFTGVTPSDYLVTKFPVSQILLQ